MLMRRRRAGMFSRAGLFVFVILLIEFLDEVVYGVGESAWPLIRDDIGLSYTDIGLLIGLPMILSSIFEIPLGLLVDLGYRRLIVLAGGLAFGLAHLLIAVSTDFWMLLFASTLSGAASGAFVTMSQTALMDADPSRHEQNMARWTLFGALGQLAGPLLLGASVALGAGWRPLFLLLALLTLALLIARALLRSEVDAQRAAHAHDELHLGLAAGFREALRAVRRVELLRWFILLAFSDLMLDVLYSYLALYFVDVVRTDAETATLALAVWTGVGVLGDFLLLPLLERVRGLVYLRYSVVANLILFPAFLLLPALPLKLVALGLLGIANAGWYSVLQAQVYTIMPGQSGTAAAVNSLLSPLSAFIPFAVGAAAHTFGLEAAMWLLLAGPLALLIGLPRGRMAASGDAAIPQE